MRYLLDTSALLAHYREEIGWEVVQGLFEDLESVIVIAIPSLAEFARRLLALGIDDAEIAAVLDNYGLLFTAVVAIDAPVALAAYYMGRRMPERIPLIDLLIAAAAQTDRAVLVHRDRHMSTIPREVVPQELLK